MDNWFEELYKKMNQPPEENMSRMASLEPQYQSVMTDMPAAPVPKSPPVAMKSLPPIQKADLAPILTPPSVAQEAPPVPEMNPLVANHMSKYMEDRKKLLEENKKDEGGLDIASALAALGAGFQGQNAMSAGLAMKQNQQSARDKKVADFDKARTLERDETKFGREDEAFARESDPNSFESKSAQQLAIKLGVNPEAVKGLTAEKFKSSSPAFLKMYEMDQRSLDRKEAIAQRTADRAAMRDERKDVRADKLEEKMQGLKTPYGLANNEDDAKKLKEAHEAKKNFDNKLQQMIDLRTKHGGGAILNRDDVGRGKQLSKDLLLEYKNMAKLGVLSQADEAIINEIIPADPLSYNSPVAAVQGQDPILNKLKSFQSDSDKDFKTRVSTRTREGLASNPELVGESPGAVQEVERKGKDGRIGIFDANTKKFLRYK